MEELMGRGRRGTAGEAGMKSKAAGRLPAFAGGSVMLKHNLRTAEWLDVEK